ncbi:DMT family transporter [Rhodococcus globerulus]|uniref:DMT family transporter n=1 Tax=Rhodococcus globerulus TaxID=33008 RepID=UPI0030194B8A
MADLSRTSTHRGSVLAVVSAAVLFGTTGTAQALASESLGYDLDPLAVGSARVVLAGLILAAFAYARGGLGFARSTSRPAILGGFGVAAYQLGFFTGVQAAGVAAGTMIALGSGPAFTGVLQYLVDRRRPGPLWFHSTLVAVAGMTLIVAGQPGDGSSNVLAGAVPALIAGLGYAIYTVAGAHMITAGVSTQGAMGQMFGIGGILLLPILIWQWPGGLDTGAGATAVVYLVVVPTVLAYLLFAAALRHLNPATVATLTLLEPVVAAILGAVVLGETITTVAMLGMATVVAALGLLTAGTLRNS